MLQWCPEEDSNLHASRRQNLNLVRLPIPPSGHKSNLQRLERAVKGAHYSTDFLAFYTEIYHRASARFAAQHLGEYLRQLLEWHNVCELRKFAWL